MRLEPYPRWWNNVRHHDLGEPARRRDDQLPGMLAQPGAPPAERAVGDDMVPAEADEPHVVEAGRRPVAVEEMMRVGELERLTRPGEIVGENEELCTRRAFGDV